MNELKVTLACGIEVDFTGKLDEPCYQYVGTLEELLKQLGGRFNSHLSCGAGWVFSKKAEGKLRAALVGA